MERCAKGHDLSHFRFEISGGGWGCRACRQDAANARWGNAKGVSRTLGDRFWAKVDRCGPDDCWEWTGARIRRGYGSLSGVEVEGGRVQSQVGAHRVSFFLAHGYWPRLVRHTCDNPPCVNPAHLLPGDEVSNAKDMVERGRSEKRQHTHCPQGHPYDDENTYVTPRGHRKCRACARVNAKVQAKKRRERDPEGFARDQAERQRRRRARKRSS